MASSSSSRKTEAVPPWLDLPREVTAAILRKLGPIEMLTTADNVCRAWRSVCRDPSMWRRIDFRFGKCRMNMEKLCRKAADCSQGQLIDVNIEYFGSDYLLLYICQRCRSLKRLQLVHTYCISTEAMIEAVKRFPQLEELHLYNTFIGLEAIEAIGCSCPLLKSFKFNNRCYMRPRVVDDLAARAIAGNMPGLRHLQLFGNRMGNEGLQAIIEGCPHLESLDLRQCFNVKLGGEMGKLCLQKIKDLRRPHDPTDDYRFDAEIYDHESSDDDYVIPMQEMCTNMMPDEYDIMVASGMPDFCYYIEAGGRVPFLYDDDDDEDNDDDDDDEDD